LAGVDEGQQDPVALWWEKVATPICSRHYTERQRRKDEAEAAILEKTLGQSSAVIHSTETGNPINSVHRLFTQAKATSVV